VNLTSLLVTMDAASIGMPFATTLMNAEIAVTKATARIHQVTFVYCLQL